MNPQATNYKLDSERGSVILYAMLSMSVMLAIGLTLNSLFIAKLQSTSAARSSIQALYAADSATELCLYEARKGTPESSPRMPLPTNMTFSITALNPAQTNVTANCSVLGSSSFGFRATGTYRGIRRTLEITQ